MADGISDKMPDKTNNSIPFHSCQKGGFCSSLCCTKIVNFGVAFGKTVALDKVNIHIHCGELTAIIGPNGAGKSTLLKAMLGEVKHTGELLFYDAKGKRSGKPLIGYVPQNAGFDSGMPVSVFDLVTISISLSPVWLRQSAASIARALSILSRANASHLIDRRIGDISGGELQRVLLALALEPIPDLLLLDEPVSGIDENGLVQFYETVSALRKEYDLSIILVSHDLDLVEKHADRVVLLNREVVKTGVPEDVFNDEGFRRIFGRGRI